MIASLYWSFTKYQLPAPPKWIGTLNYQFMFTKDPFFWVAVRNTIWIIVVGLPIRIAFGIITALLLTQEASGGERYRTMFFLPTMAPVVAATLAFAYLLNPEYGPVNVLLRKIGIAASAAVVLLTPVVEAGPRPPRPLGRRRRDDHLPRGVPRRAQAPV